jgi:hypothetical protein
MIASVYLLGLHILVAQAPRHEDCLPYNPQTLKVVEEELMNTWRLTDGHSSMLTFGTAQDAENGLAVAERYSEQCFIGRHASTRPGAKTDAHQRYIVNYWKAPTGKQTRISPEACQAYVGSELRAEDNGAAGWTVTDERDFHVPVDNSADADALITLARQYTAHCTIGGTDPPSPVRRVDYWK